MQRIAALLTMFFLLSFISVKSQYKSFKLNGDGDTLNIIDKNGLKQGKWVISVPEIREEPGYDEEGVFKNDKKEGLWKRYTSDGDIIAIENYRFGGKDGTQKYFTFIGQLEKTEEWHSYDPKSPYDTIPVYGVGNDEIIKYNIVKATQYSVPDGQWTYYNPNSGAVTKVERYNRGLLLKDDPEASQLNTTNKTGVAANPSDSTKSAVTKEKPQEVLDYEKKYSKKKKKVAEITGQTGL